MKSKRLKRDSVPNSPVSVGVKSRLDEFSEPYSDKQPTMQSFLREKSYDQLPNFSSQIYGETPSSDEDLYAEYNFDSALSKQYGKKLLVYVYDSYLMKHGNMNHKEICKSWKGLS